MDPGELEILSAVLDSYCRSHGIVSDDDKDDLARRAIALYENGMHSPNELLSRLERDR
jgi:hypothetical protein